MVFLKAEAFFNDHTQDNIRLLIRAETEFPQEWISTFKRIVEPLTPIDTGALRKSIITRQIPKGAEVSWTMPYALVQNEGHHKVERRVIGENQRDGGFGIIPARVYTNYKHPIGGDKNFAEKAATATNKEVPAMWRKIGLTK